MDLSALLRYLRLLIGRILGVVNSRPSVILPPQTSLLALPGFVPPGFNGGLEILNEDRTPMEFVVSTLGTDIGLDRKDSIRTMLAIHSRGGALLAMSSMNEAKKGRSAVTAEAAEHNYPLVCRAVNTSV